jgi:lipid-binding SYLF domain-containing protein
MTTFLPRLKSFLLVAGASLTLLVTAPAQASQLDEDIDAALKSENAKGILVFPNITKAGFIVGGQGGNGALIKQGKKVGYYNTAAVSVGMQAGIQTYGYALFFMSDAVMKNFEKSKGWEVGVGPSVVVVDSGMGKDVSTLTAKADIYAFIFDQKGLMAGLGIKGSKITKLKTAR